MSRARDLFGGAAGVAIAGLALMTTAGAQQRTPPVQPMAAEMMSTPAAEDPVLVFEREVFDYASGGRRDPFRALADGEGTGPLFDDLNLRMIIFVEAAPAQSVALLVDASGKVHRVRRGDIIGNAQVQDIASAHVVFSVENLGVRRQQVLALKKPTQGA